MKNIPFGMPYDFSKIEERLLSEYAAGATVLEDAVMQLPRKHPARFALLYGSGPAMLERMTRHDTPLPAVNPQDMVTVRKLHAKIHLEAEIQVFENWQKNENAAALRTLRAENGAIAYEAMEVAAELLPLDLKVPMTLDGSLAGRWHTGGVSEAPGNSAEYGTITGRIPSGWGNGPDIGPVTYEDMKAMIASLENIPTYKRAPRFFDRERVQLPALNFLVQSGNTDAELRPLLERLDDWCRCGGEGFWYEQIDGPNNLRKVKCDRHEEHPYPAEGILRD